MTTNDLLSPALLHAMAVFIVALTVLQVAAYSGVIALVAQRTPLTQRTQFAVPLLIAASLAAWLGWVVLAVHEPVATPVPTSSGVQNLGLLLEIGVFFSLRIFAVFFSNSLRA